MKKCSKCNKEQELTEFNKNKATADGLQTQCKSCKKAYRKANKNRIAAYGKTYYENNREKMCAQNKTNYENNREERIAKNKDYYRANVEKKTIYRKNHYESNKEKLIAQQLIYVRGRRSNDKVFRVMQNIRSQVRLRLKNKKSKRVVELLGCSPEYFHNFVMLGQDVDADHIYPVSWFDMDNPDHVKVAWHHSNFQPLDATSNSAKGNRYAGTPDNIICYREDFNVEEYVAMMLPKINIPLHVNA